MRLELAGNLETALALVAHVGLLMEVHASVGLKCDGIVTALRAVAARIRDVVAGMMARHVALEATQLDELLQALGTLVEFVAAAAWSASSGCDGSRLIPWFELSFRSVQLEVVLEGAL